jgi:hypothetical protein
MVHLNQETRFNIVNAYKTLGSLKAVSRLLKVNVKTARHWVRRYKHDPDLSTVKGRGRKRVISSKVALDAVDMLLSNKFDNAKEVSQQLFNEGKIDGSKAPHPSTITRNAKSAAKAQGKPIKAVRGKPGKALAEKTKRQRLQFCKANIKKSWNKVMFTDRKRFMFKYPGTCVRKVGWVRVGQRRTAIISSHPQCVNVYAGVTRYGMTKIHIVSGTSGCTSRFKNQKGQPSKNITIAEYEHVVLDTLLPEGKRMFAANNTSNWQLQQDNDPSHPKGSDRALKEWRKKVPGSSVSILPKWPPHSPDLSPIENIWGYVQDQVDAAGCETFAQFKQCVKQKLQDVPQSYIKEMFKSMKKRMIECVQARGDRIAY